MKTSSMENEAQKAGCQIPITLKLAFTAFMVVLIPVYLTNYGPTNFLCFCDIALLLTMAGGR